MKELARRFSCRLSNGGDGEPLRLLPRPIYRYQVDRADLMDGALFAYVVGTDPEVLLVLEAARHDGQSRWQYALTRRTPGALEADLDGQRVWTVPRDYGAPDQIWFSTTVPLHRDAPRDQVQRVARAGQGASIQLSRSPRPDDRLACHLCAPWQIISP